MPRVLDRLTFRSAKYVNSINLFQWSAQIEKRNFLLKAKETYLTSSNFLVMTEPTVEKAAEAFWPAWDRVSDVLLYLCSNKIKSAVILTEHMRNF